MYDENNTALGSTMHTRTCTAMALSASSPRSSSSSSSAASSSRSTISAFSRRGGDISPRHHADYTLAAAVPPATRESIKSASHCRKCLLFYQNSPSATKNAHYGGPLHHVVPRPAATKANPQYKPSQLVELWLVDTGWASRGKESRQRCPNFELVETLCFISHDLKFNIPLCRRLLLNLYFFLLQRREQCGGSNRRQQQSSVVLLHDGRLGKGGMPCCHELATRLEMR
jgi:hypothetical protein